MSFSCSHIHLKCLIRYCFSHQEILRNEKARREVGAKAQGLIQQEKHLQSIEDKGPLNSPMKTQIKGHASAPVYSKHTASEEPSSTASTFEPGSWNPQKK